MKGVKKYFILLAAASLLIYGAGQALASDHALTAGYGANTQTSMGCLWPGLTDAQQLEGAQTGQPNGDGNPYGSNGTLNNGQTGYGNASMPQVDFSGLPYGEWQKWAYSYRARPKYPYVFNFSNPYELADKNVLTNGQKWFNDSWNDSRSDISKKIAGQRVLTLLQEMEMLKTMAGESGLSAEERTAIASGIDNNARWLEDADKGIHAAGDMKSLGQAVAGAEPRIALIRSEVKANAGLLACKDMDAKIDQAMNASDLINERIQSPNLTQEEKAWHVQKLAGYDQHVYNASQYHANARASFQRFSETGDDAYYVEGLKQIELAHSELDGAFITLKEIFRRINL